jgi:ATP-dependent Clp protease ATP-binding subunit ClpA
MTPLDSTLLSEARSSRDRLLELQRDLEKARADYNHAIRRLHAQGGSLREIAEDLGVSHQRVHQIVDSAEVGPARGGPHRGGHRFSWRFERFTRKARQVVQVAQEESEALGHGRVGTEHLLLGLARADDETITPILADAGLTADRVRERVATWQYPQRRRTFTGFAKKALEQSLVEARDLGDSYIGAEHVLLGVLASDRFGSVEIVRDLGADPAALREAVVARRAPKS